MEELVKVIKNDVFTDSLVIADGTGNEHNSVTRVIRNYTADFKEFGEIRFMDLKSKNSQGGRPIKVYLLNESQATLLMTYLGNSETVRKFKVELVRQFYSMRQYIMEHNSPVWQQTRDLVKEIRKREGVFIQQFIDYAFAHGSQNAEWYYCSLSTLADKAAGIKPKQRDAADIEHLTQLYLIENILGEVIKEGIQQELPYKNIYQACKAKLGQFKAIAYIN